MPWKKITLLFDVKDQGSEQKVFEDLTDDARSEDKGGKGGFSISINTGAGPSTGFMISDFGSEKKHAFDQDRPHLSIPDLRGFIRTNSGLLKPAEKYFGGWLDDSGKLCLDVSSNIHCTHDPDKTCKHRLNAYLKMVTNKQDAIYHVHGREGHQFLDADKAAQEYPEYAELFNQHKRDMEEYRKQAEARTASVVKSNGGKVFFRLGPDASDEELLDILKQISTK